MYRALTWWLLDQDVAVDDPAAVAAQADRPRIEVGIDPDAPWVAVDGRDVSAEIRTREVSAAVSAVAAVPRVRAHLIAQQRAIIAAARRDHGGAVVEGRDIGTVVAPDAVVKVYLTASTTARAHRRTAELAHDPAATPRRTEADQARRDRLDAPQSMRAADAVQIDSTRHGLDDVVQMIVGLVRECAATPAAARPAR